MTPRSALLAAWGGAWLAGESSLEEAVAAAVGGDEAAAVAGLDAPDLPLDRGLPRLRAGGVIRLRVVLPAPGDPLGLPGPGPFTSAALLAGEGVLATRDDGSGTGLVPTVVEHGSPLEGVVTSARWTSYPLAAVPPWQGPWLPEADGELRQGVLRVAAAFRDLDVARWRPELADALRDLRATARAVRGDDELPSGYSPRAKELLARAAQVAGVVELAGVDAGGAVDSRETAAREEHLRELARLVRHARVAAYNSYADSLAAGRR
jgi:hypothetical protein